MIEFVLIIAGIVIGFQITQANQQRQDRVTERAYLLQIHDEIVAGVDDGWQARRYQYYSARRSETQGIALLLFGDETDASLTPDQCAVFSEIHSIYTLATMTPSLEEMVVNGQLLLVRNDALRRQLARYRLDREEMTGLTEALIEGITVLPLAFPDLLPASFATPRRGPIFAATACDLNAMRANQAFLNAFADTYDRMDYYIVLVMQRDIESARSIHLALDSELGLEHSQIPATQN